jgi:hypothetical protein
MKNLAKANSLFVLFVFQILLLIGCDNDKSAIKKDLNSRFTKVEIVEIRKDSTNVRQALNILNSLKVRISEANLNIVKALYSEDSSNRTPYQNYLYMDSIQQDIIQSLKKFEDSKFDKKEPCYYVKYLISKDEIKIPKEEYYFLDKYNGDVLHRPCEWEDFMYEQGYSDIIKDALKYRSEIFNLELKYHNN